MTESDLQSRVTRTLAALDPSPELPTIVATRVATRERQRRVARLGGAALAMVLVLVGAGLIVRLGADDPSVIAGDPSTSRRWETLPPPPIPPRRGPSAVWTGSEMIFWGGSEVVGSDGAWSSREGLRADGAAFNPSTRTWRVLAPAPIGPRTWNSATWTGKEVLMWGGVRPSGEEPAGYADGAAYDPATDSWRLIPQGPIGARVDFGSVWTGTELLVIGGVRAGDRGSQVAAAYDPERNSWRPLADPGFSLGSGGSAVWTGTEVLYWRTEVKPELFAYDPKADTWTKRSDPARSFRLSWTDAGFVWTGQAFVVASSTFNGGGDEQRVEAIAFDPRKDAWQRVILKKDPRNALVAGQTTATWTGREIVLVSYIGSYASTLDPVSKDWRPTPDMPTIRYGPSTIAAGGDGDTYVWGDEVQARFTRQPRR